jgi:hypothetical protein
MSRASRGRRDLPASCSEVAGIKAGLATDELALVMFGCDEALLVEGGSAGGVRGCVVDVWVWSGEAISPSTV